ncbi:hypothetical protein GW17_00033018 [Ensete ventricosum]|nr:hypothetical protein GW17_00033018 [Ensete ventricosum]RZS00678.1 hypothetical protein BHM03_00030431 [Ensete ventricosum]
MGRLLVIDTAEDEDNETSEEALKPKEEAMEEESQPGNYAVHALADYSNLQMMKVGGLLKQQPITILIDIGSTNNFLNSKVAACLALQIEGDRHSLRAIAPMSEWHRLAWPPGPRVAPPHVATWPADDRHAGVLAGTAYASDLGCRRSLQAA